MENMLINVTQQDELRVALLKDNVLFDLDIEKQNSITKKANIYKGIVSNIQLGLGAAFVRYGTGAERQGFLPLKEIAPQYYQTKAEGEHPNIKQLLRENQELMVQIDKEERGTKGAALTTYITLAGCYLVLMTNTSKPGGISRRIEGEEREELREKLRNLVVPDNMGVIIRTSGMGKSLEDLQWDLDVLLNQWEAIKEAYKRQSAPFLIHQEGDVIIRSIRDNLHKSVEEIIIDDPEIYVKARNYIEQVNPSFLNNVKLYSDKVPLFSRYHIEGQIKTVFERTVPLPSGGTIVIDSTEALVSIDINSAKSTGGADIETTAFTTNVEAAHEIARQLRLRDLGGLIVIDFIDMVQYQNQREVENALQEALKADRARVQVGRISRFGLLEMSRQRLRLAIDEASQVICPRCDGRGMIRSIHSLAASILHLIEEEATKPTAGRIQAQLPVPLATFILNERRSALLAIEKRHEIPILILPNPHLEVPHYKIEYVRDTGKTSASFQLIEEPKLEAISPITGESKKESIEQPAIRAIPTPPRPLARKKGIMQRLRKLFAAQEKVEQPEKPVEKPPLQTTKTHTGQQQRVGPHRRGTRSKQSYARKRMPGAKRVSRRRP